MYVDTALSMSQELTFYAANANGLNGGHMGLMTALTIQTPAAVLGDLTEPTFAGYARAVLTTYPGAYVAPGGISAEMPAPAIVFTCTSAPATPETIIGYFILDKNDQLVGWELFDTPIDVVVGGQQVPIVMKMVRKVKGF